MFGSLYFLTPVETNNNNKCGLKREHIYCLTSPWVWMENGLAGSIPSVRSMKEAVFLLFLQGPFDDIGKPTVTFSSQEPYFILVRT